MRRSFTLRRLLAFALVAAILLPLTLGTAMWFGVRHWQDDRRSAHVAAATKLIEDGVGRFDSPAWRRSARARLDSLGIGAQVVVARPGTKGVVFTAGSGASAETLKSPAGSRKTPALKLPRGYFAALVVPGLNGSSRWLAALLAAIGTFVALLTAFSLLARRWVVRPLAALSEAVDAIAGGTSFPRGRSSRVREIDELEEAATKPGPSRMRRAGGRSLALSAESVTPRTSSLPRPSSRPFLTYARRRRREQITACANTVL
jgi:hypothetical protein